MTDTPDPVTEQLTVEQALNEAITALQTLSFRGDLDEADRATTKRWISRWREAMRTAATRLRAQEGPHDADENSKPPSRHAGPRRLRRTRR